MHIENYLLFYKKNMLLIPYNIFYLYIYTAPFSKQQIINFNYYAYEKENCMYLKWITYNPLCL